MIRHGPVALSLTSLRHPHDPHRQRIDAERVVVLAHDIAANGLLQPIGVRGPFPDGTYEVGYGDRRTYAMEYLKRATVDAYVWPAAFDILEIRASENLMHEPLDPVEEAKIAERYKAQGMPDAVIAAKMGHTVTWVRERVAILAYPDDVRQEIAAGRLSLAVAAILVQIPHEGVRSEFLGEAIRTGATSRTADVWLAHWLADGARMARNHVAIETIIREAESYVIHIACEGCERSVSITETRTLRFCARCLDDVRKAAAGE